MLKEDDILFVLTKEDAQIIAREIMGRKLSLLEIQYVKRGLEYGLDDWNEVMRIAIKKAVEQVKF
jgi:chemotaxis protein CheY-P-specific phosphatase CheC